MQTLISFLPKLITLDKPSDINHLTNHLCDNNLAAINMLPKNISYPFSAKVVYDLETVGAYILPA